MVEPYEGIYFISTRTDHDPLIWKSGKIRVVTELTVLEQYLSEKKHAGLDCESNGGRFYISDVLLIQLGDRVTQFVLDCTCDLFPQIVALLIKYADKLLFFGHNIKFDLNLLRRYGIIIPYIYDTMIGAQRIYLGRVDVEYNLVWVFEDMLKIHMSTNKETRSDFLTMTLKSTFKISHIVYGAKDVSHLEDIARAQKKILESRGQWEWFRNFENGLTPELSKMEMFGITLYEDKYRPILAEKKVEKLKVEQKLDGDLDVLLGTKTRVRNRVTIQQTSIFDAPVEIETSNNKHVNYSSSVQVLKLLAKTGEPVPTFKERGKDLKPSMREAGLQQYLIERPTSKLKTFLTDYMQYQEYQKFISSYGIKFFNYAIRKKKSKKVEWGYKNPVTENVHTIFKQCSTDTGRLASGDAKMGYFNSQQIPAKKAIRECFGLNTVEIEDGYWLTTCDLSGAELIIMAALADDQHLYELGADKIIDGKKVEGDLHSPLATKSWRAVYQKRKEVFLATYGMPTWESASSEKLDNYFSIYDTENKAYILTHDFVVSRDCNKQLRTDFKRMGFGTVYGLKAKKGAQTLNINNTEAQVVIDVIKNEIPRTFAMVEAAAKCAIADGYVIFNNRSNNRRWFTEVITMIERDNLWDIDRSKRYNIIKNELNFMQLSDIEGAARNCRIQGTQADMIKEATVKVGKFFNRYPREGCRLNVHDELAVAHKTKDAGLEVGKIMTEVANLYLAPYSNNIRMRCESHTLHTWTK